ncbi:protein translocase subunit SecDF [Abditibacteriota bacterium]|nr:protein translocase subunit SecDF [Abditibacteriota bacterium]
MDFRGKNIDLVGKMWLWFGISAALILVGMVSLALFNLNYGIDFKGGSQFTYRIPTALRGALANEQGQADLLAKVNKGLNDGGLIGTRSQIAGSTDLVVNTPALTASEAQTQENITSKAVSSAFGAPTAPEGRQQVGAVIGDELRSNAIKGVVIGVMLIALWIYIRYNFAGDGLRYAVAGIVALLHDVLVLIGLFALIGKIDPRVEVDGGFIAALLTVVGYSINDSVVIFDRLRENLRSRRGEPFNKVVNDSLLETMSRSINTGLTVLLMLFVLLLFGGESIYNFTLAMLLGIASGLYSSIFNASMVLVLWHQFDEKKAAQAKANRTNVSVRETPRQTAVKRSK